jgi:iron complex outermembrane receptor protein
MQAKWAAASLLLLTNAVSAQDAATSPDDGSTSASAELPTIPVSPDAPTEPAPERASSPQQIEEVIVSATKRDQALREIPASITALKGDNLERSGARGVEDIARLVPGVTFSDDTINASKVTIRGISTTTLGNPTTGTLFGDVSFTDAYLPRVTLDPNPFDMQTVEVLKGPQGTLFGSAALNGAVRYVPQPPKFGEYETRWFAQYSLVDHGDGAPTYGAAINLPFGDDLAVRGMAFKRESPGWIDNERTGEHNVNSLSQQGARGIIGWRPDDVLDVRFSYVWQQTNVDDSPVSDGDDGSLSRSSTTHPSTSDSQYKLADLVLRYSLDEIDVVSDSAWVGKSAHKQSDVSSDLTGGATPYVLLDDISDTQTYSQELRLVSTDSASPWRWVTGVFGSRQDLHFVPAYSTPLVPGLDVASQLAALGLTGNGAVVTDQGLNILRVQTDAKVEDLALFGDVTRRVSDDAVELSVGGRLYRTQSNGRVVQDGALVLTEGQVQAVNQGKITDEGFNPKASALWHVNNDVNVYAAISKGFRTGGLQPGFTTPLSAKQAPDRFKSDTLWNYELGTRTQWLDRTLQFDATAFYIDWKDPQTLLADSVLHLPYLDNVGRVTSVGVETATRWLPTFLPGLSINASGAWIHTETAEAFEGQTGATIPKGTPFPYTARWQTATTVAYTHAFGNWKAGTSVTHTFISKAYADLEKTLPLFDYQQWDLQWNLVNPSIVWLPEASVTLSNLTDERGVANASEGGLLIRVQKSTYIQPRALLLRLSGSF